MFSVRPPKVEGTPEKTVKKTSATKTPPATSSKTPPPKPAPKPKPSPKAKENEVTSYGLVVKYDKCESY